MGRRFPTLALVLATGLAWGWTGAAQGEELALGRFSQGDLTGWQVKEFKGRTEYALVQDQGRTVLKAQSRGTASGLFKELDLDPRRYRLLRWSWKVEGTIPGGDERTKAGDDYAARVYLVFPRTFFWQTRALNYIWANLLAPGRHLPNAFSSQAVLLAVRSGNQEAGQWRQEERDLYDDYRLVFGEEPARIGGVAIMTDTDNTGSNAVAYYGDISLISREP